MKTELTNIEFNYLATQMNYGSLSPESQREKEMLEVINSLCNIGLQLVKVLKKENDITCNSLSEEEWQILYLLAYEGLKMMDAQSRYFMEAWFNRDQAQEVVRKVDKIDGEIRKGIAD